MDQRVKYNLEREEIEESLLCLDWKKEGVRKRLNLYMLSGVGIFCITGLARDSLQGESVNMVLFFLGLITVLTMFTVLYAPAVRRKKKAKKMYCRDGMYEFTFGQEGISHAYESERVFTVKSRQDVWCIPKRVLDLERIKEVREELTQGSGRFITVQTERKV